MLSQYLVDRTASGEARSAKYSNRADLPADLQEPFEQLTRRAVAMAIPGRFTVDDVMEVVDRTSGDDSVADATVQVALSMTGTIAESQSWQPERFTVTRPGQSPVEYRQLADVPAAVSRAFRRADRAIKVCNWSVWSAMCGQHGSLPPLDWAMLAAFAAIAGAGGLTNTLFSNFARDAGWGMGARVGTIPSAVGGRQIQLSHVGEVFPLDEANRSRWHGWMRHVRRDQLAVWMLCSVIGMALPCMLSLEFIRHAPVSGDRVAAMMAERHGRPLSGLSARPCGSPRCCADSWCWRRGRSCRATMISRRWTDIIWTSNSRVQRMPGDRVRRIYYSILTLVRHLGPGRAHVVRSAANRQDLGRADEHRAGLVGAALGLRQSDAAAASSCSRRW